MDERQGKSTNGEAQPSVSVIIPVYNAAPFLHQRIESVQKQTLQNIEIICVDDGSTDASFRILQEFATSDHRMSVYQCKHKNAGFARDYGMNRASGKYIIFLDADDYCQPNMLETLFITAEKRKADVVVCRTMNYSESTGKKSRAVGAIKDAYIPNTKNGVFSYRDCPEKIFQLFVAWTWDKLYRFSIIKENGLKAQHLQAANSFAFCCGVLVKAKRIVVVDRYLCVQRRDVQTSITKQLNIAWNCGYLASLKLKTDLESWGLYDKLKISYQNIALHNLVWYLSKLEEFPDIYEKLYKKIHGQYLRDLDLVNLDKSTIYNQKEYQLYKILKEASFSEGLLRLLAQSQQKAESLQYENKQLKEQIRRRESAFKNSVSYKIGRSITFIPRKMREARNRLLQLIDVAKQIANNKKSCKTGIKKICIVAYENFHAFILNSIIKISNYNENYVEVFTIAAMKNELMDYLGIDENKIHWVIIPESKNKGKKREEENLELRLLVSKRISRLKYWDMIIFPSAEYRYMEYSPILLRPPKNTEIVAMIHNVNRVFCGESIDPQLCRLLGRASSYAVLDKLLIDDIKRRKLTEKKVYEFPIVFQEYEKNYEQYENERIIFVITGHVEKERKDYDLVIKAFSKLDAYYDRLSLVLLGPATKPYGKKIIEKCKELRENGLLVQFYENHVPTELFRLVMHRADFILGPVSIHYTGNGLDEIYNVTKMTGITTDMIEYSKPGIIPSELKTPERLKSSTVYYHTPEELVDVIISLLDRETVHKLTYNAQENSRKYELSKYLIT